MKKVIALLFFIAFTVFNIAAEINKHDVMVCSANLRLRSSSNLDSSIVTTMPKDSIVVVEEIGKSDNIGGYNSNWVKVTVADGTQRNNGWCFGGYLDNYSEYFCEKINYSNVVGKNNWREIIFELYPDEQLINMYEPFSSIKYIYPIKVPNLFEGYMIEYNSDNDIGLPRCVIGRNSNKEKFKILKLSDGYHTIFANFIIINNITYLICPFYSPDDSFSLTIRKLTYNNKNGQLGTVDLYYKDYPAGE